MTETTNDNGAELLIELTAEIVAAYVSNNSVAANDLPNVITQVHAAWKMARSSSRSSAIS